MSFHARALTARHLRDIKWMREAEIKHGRVAMLATIGYTYPEAPWAVQAFPGEAYSHANPIKAAIAVPPGAWANIIFFVGLMEFATNRGKMTMMEMFEDPFFYSVRRTRRAAPARLQALRSPSRRPCAPKPFAPRRRKRVPGDLGWDPARPRRLVASRFAKTRSRRARPLAAALS